MRKAYITIMIGILLLVGVLLWSYGVQLEGFQTLPTTPVSISQFAVFASMNEIMEKLPFLHTNFSKIDTVDIAGLSTPLSSVPTESAITSFLNINALVPSDTTVKLYLFKLKEPIVGPLDQAAIDALNNASTSLFGGPGKIAFMTGERALYPSLALPAALEPAPVAPAPAPAPAAPLTLTLTKQADAGQRSWTQIAISSDGNVYYAGAGTILYRSMDGGSSFLGIIDLSGTITGLTCSANGETIGISTNDRGIYIGQFVNDILNIRTNISYGELYSGIAGSTDGLKYAAYAYTYTLGPIITSTNGGSSWIQQSSSGQRAWNSIASSADGIRLVATVDRGYIYTSSDGGFTWKEQTSAGTQAWTDITISADGMKLAASVSKGQLFTSWDGGSTWINRTTPDVKWWSAISSSADGTKLAACVLGGSIFTSSDSGSTWVEQPATTGNWRQIRISSDGTKIFAFTEMNGSQEQGYIYTGILA